MILMFLTGAGVLVMMFWMISPCPEGAMLRIWLKSVELKASRASSKINDISKVIAGADNAFDVPDWGWCP